MYEWRKMTEAQKKEALENRRKKSRPWHSPPHLDVPGEKAYIITAACYEHQHILREKPDRLDEFTELLLSEIMEHIAKLYAWCVLPNHYHLLLKTEGIKSLRGKLGAIHGKTSRKWNLEDKKTGRKVWCNCFERPMKSEAHFYASLNYIHHNPVKHEFVEKWTDYPFSSASDFLEVMGRETVSALWRQYPLGNYGKGWDW